MGMPAHSEAEWKCEPPKNARAIRCLMVRHFVLEIVEDRYGRGGARITSQIPVDRWHDFFGEPTLADAILDWIVDNAHRLQLRVDSLRKRRAANSAAA
jgi:DNA replication protein DnaC